MALMNDLIDTIIAELTNEFLASGDATHIEYGRKFEEPELDVLVYWGGESDEDRLNTTKRDESGSFTAHTYEVGGYGFHLWRNVRVEFRLHQVGVAREVARAHAMDIESRTIRRVTRMPFPQSSDTEQPVFCEYVSSHMTESGGDSRWIWEGRVRFRILTHFE